MPLAGRHIVNPSWHPTSTNSEKGKSELSASGARGATSQLVAFRKIEYPVPQERGLWEENCWEASEWEEQEQGFNLVSWSWYSQHDLQPQERSEQSEKLWNIL